MATRTSTGGTMARGVMMKQTQDPWLSVQDIAEELGVSHALVLKLVVAGDIAGIKVGRLWRVRRSAVTAWERKQRPEEDPNLVAAAAGWGR